MRRVPRPAAGTLHAWLLSRAAIVFVMALAEYLQARHGVGRSPLRPGDTGFFVWDGDWYRRIAAYGYQSDQALRFFPLVALPARLFAPLGPLPAGIALIAFVNASALVYAEALARLTAWELRDADAARWVPWLTLFAPASFVLVLGYAEATAGALAVWCLWSLRRRAWLPAAAAAFLGGLARPIGLLLAVPALVEAARGLRGSGSGEVARRALAVAAAPLGCAAYLGWVWATRGDPLLPFSVQQAGSLRDGVLSWPGGLIVDAFTGQAGRAATFHAPWVPIVLLLLVLCARRLPASYTAYAGALLVMALGTPRLASFLRYAFAAFPLIMVAASLRPRGVRLVTFLVCCLALGGYSVLAFTHRYVP